jgi:hypothetical protein
MKNTCTQRCIGMYVAVKHLSNLTETIQIYVFQTLEAFQTSVVRCRFPFSRSVQSTFHDSGAVEENRIAI